MANRTMQAKTDRMKQRAIVAKLGSAKRWGDPRPKSRLKNNWKLVAADINVLRKARKISRGLE